MTTDHSYGTSPDVACQVSPLRFYEGNGPTWTEFSAALQVLDKVWRNRRVGNTAFGVFGPRPSWEDTIYRGQLLFEVDSWTELDEDQQEMIAPTHFFANGDALLGSIGRRSNDVRAFLSSPDSANNREMVLSLIKQAKSLNTSSLPLLAGDILAEMCTARGMGRAFATRLLALARPDGFIVLNNKSKEWLQRASGFALAGKSRTYNNLLRWLSRQDWYQSPEPDDALERRLWRMRAALLDAYAYQPWN